MLVYKNERLGKRITNLVDVVSPGLQLQVLVIKVKDEEGTERRK